MTNKLKLLESESIQIFREVISEIDNPAMLYSLGKDSSVLLHIAKKAFWPKKITFPLLHIDTGWKFREMYEFKNRLIESEEVEVITYKNERGIQKKINPINHDAKTHTKVMKTDALKQALNKFKFNAVFGGARRDEEKSRAKERIFSLRNNKHQWDPKNQRPELWDLYNTKVLNEESLRVFPLSNWTELDIWSYIKKENIEIVPLYFAKTRPVVNRDGMLIMVDDDRLNLAKDEKVKNLSIRFRTLGCYPLTAAIQSNATSIDKILTELESSSFSERQGRLIDKDDVASMEKKKIEGYF